MQKYDKSDIKIFNYQINDQLIDPIYLFIVIIRSAVDLDQLNHLNANVQYFL